MGELVKKAEVVKTQDRFKETAARLRKGLNVGEAKKEIQETKKVLKAQLEKTEKAHFDASNKDPEDIPRGDLAGAQEGILETADDQVKAILGYMSSPTVDVGDTAKRLDEVVAGLGKYMDKLEDGMTTFRSEEEKATRGGEY